VCYPYTEWEEEEGMERERERERGGPEEWRDRGREGGGRKWGREGKGREGKERKGRNEGRKERMMNRWKGGSYSSCIISVTPIKKLRTQNLQPGYKNHFVNMLYCGVCFSK